MYTIRITDDITIFTEFPHFATFRRQRYGTIYNYRFTQKLISVYNKDWIYSRRFFQWIPALQIQHPRPGTGETPHGARTRNKGR